MSSDLKTIPCIEPPWPFESYAHIVSPIPEEDGGGFLLTMPDFPGLMADGETMDAAVEDGRAAFVATVSALADMGRGIPQPSFQPDAVPDVSGKFVTRVPKSIHAKLAARARAEGVSLNALVLALLAEGLGPRRAA